MDPTIDDSKPPLSAIVARVDGERSPPHMATAIMAKGDVHVLARLAKSDRSADRATRLLIRKLGRTKRNRKAASHPTVTSPFFHAMSFASKTNLIYHEDVLTAKRRLSKARDAHGHRAFYVDELSCSLDTEEPRGLVVVPHSQLAAPEWVGQCITKDSHTRSTTSADSVIVLHAKDSTIIQCAGVTGNKVAVCKLHVSNGMTLFYARVIQDIDSSSHSCSPWRLGLDKKTTASMQQVVARLVGAKLE